MSRVAGNPDGLPRPTNASLQGVSTTGTKRKAKKKWGEQEEDLIVSLQRIIALHHHHRPKQTENEAECGKKSQRLS